MGYVSVANIREILDKICYYLTGKFIIVRYNIYTSKRLR